MEWYTSRKIDVLIHGSTLLNFVRYRDINPREGCVEDKEINLAILDEDFLDKYAKDLYETNGYFKAIENSQSRFSGIYYAKNAKEFPTHTQWSIKPGCVFLTRLWKGKTTRYKHHEHNNCILIPNKFVDDKDKWTTIEILGREFKAPTSIGEFLDYYYGKWWTEDRKWHWSVSPHKRDYRDLLKSGEIL